MSERRPYALVSIRWLPLPVGNKYPGTSSFGATGYREGDGPSGLFSVYVKLLDGSPGPGVKQVARLYALVEAMQARLPNIGTNFYLTAGRTVVAECLTKDRGEEEVS